VKEVIVLSWVTTFPLPFISCAEELIVESNMLEIKIKREKDDFRKFIIADLLVCIFFCKNNIYFCRQIYWN
jgi:hypothetical protein